MKTKLLLTASFALLAACQSTGTPPASTPDPLVQALSGKTLVTSGGQEINLNRDGSLSGLATGTWTIKDGKYCRTITAPERLKSTGCQDVTIDGDQATFLREDGSSVTLTIK